MRSTVRLTTVSRVCVPAPIRDELGIGGGDTVEVAVASLGGENRIPLTARVYTNGRINIPVRVRDALNVEEGDLLEIDVRVEA